MKDPNPNQDDLCCKNCYQMFTAYSESVFVFGQQRKCDAHCSVNSASEREGVRKKVGLSGKTVLQTHRILRKKTPWVFSVGPTRTCHIWSMSDIPGIFLPLLPQTVKDLPYFPSLLFFSFKTKIFSYFSSFFLLFKNWYFLSQKVLLFIPSKIDIAFNRYQLQTHLASLPRTKDSETKQILISKDLSLTKQGETQMPL